MSKIHDWDLSETNLRRLSENHYEVAVLGAAAVEPHNRHLPEGQDWRHTTWVMRESCRRAWEKSPKVLCLPTIPYGVDCNLLDFPFAIHVYGPGYYLVPQALWIQEVCHHQRPRGE